MEMISFALTNLTYLTFFLILFMSFVDLRYRSIVTGYEIHTILTTPLDPIWPHKFAPIWLRDKTGAMASLLNCLTYVGVIQRGHMEPAQFLSLHCDNHLE
jgi:hypothetical protein